MKKLFFGAAMTTLLLLLFTQCKKDVVLFESNTDNLQTLAANQTIHDENYARELISNLGITEISETEFLSDANFTGTFCEPPEDSCSYVFVRDTISVPNCCDSISVNYRFHVCIDADGNTYFAFDQFHAYPLTPECQSTWDYWNSLLGQGLLDSLDRELVRFDYKTSIVAEDNLLTEFIQETGGSYQCPNSFIQSDFYTASCFQRCALLGGIFPPTEFTKIFCGPKCCKRVREYCEDSEGNVISSVPIFVTVDDNCSNFPQGTSFICPLPWGQCDKGCGAP